MSEQPTGGCTWPEQDVIDSWLRKHRVVVTITDGMELKDAVTKIRLDQVQQATAAGCQAEQVMREQRDAAEARFVRIRAENDDLQEMLKRAEALERVAKVKVANLRSDLAAQTERGNLLAFLAGVVTVVLVVIVACHV